MIARVCLGIYLVVVGLAALGLAFVPSVITGLLALVAGVAYLAGR